MRYIAAPWREAYLRNALKPKPCIFCRALKALEDREAYVLRRGKHNFILLNKYPYTPGHVMIAPCRHLADFGRASTEAAAELADLLRLSLQVLRRAYHPHGFNAGMNLGTSAGAGVAGHYHLHVIPRWTGDSNFMPLVGRTRVFIEDLDATYGRLKPLFDERRPGKGGRSGRTRS